MTTATNGNGKQTTPTRAMETVTPTARDAAILEITGWKAAEVDAIKRAIMPTATDAELMVFARVCKRTGLDPFAKQVYALRGWDAKTQRETVGFYVGIDGLRLTAQRTGDYAGRMGPQWCAADGVWRDIWLDDDPPAAARVGVLRRGWTEPVWGVATFKSFAQRARDGKLTPTWGKMPEHMLAVRAEAQALRAAFPAELADIEYGDDPPPATFRGTGTAADLYSDEPAPVRRAAAAPTPAHVVDVTSGEVLDLDDPQEDLTPVQKLAVEASQRIPLHRTEATRGAPLIGDVQMKRLHALGKEKGYSHEQLHEWAANVYAADSLTELTMRQAADMIQQLEGAPIQSVGANK